MGTISRTWKIPPTSWPSLRNGKCAHTQALCVPRTRTHPLTRIGAHDARTARAQTLTPLMLMHRMIVGSLLCVICLLVGGVFPPLVIEVGLIMYNMVVFVAAAAWVTYVIFELLKNYHVYKHLPKSLQRGLDLFCCCCSSSGRRKSISFTADHLHWEVNLLPHWKWVIKHLISHCRHRMARATACPNSWARSL